MVKAADHRVLSDLQNDSSVEVSKVGHRCHELCNRIRPRRTDILHGTEPERFQQDNCPQRMVGVRGDYSEKFGLNNEQGDNLARRQQGGASSLVKGRLNQGQVVMQKSSSAPLVTTGSKYNCSSSVHQISSTHPRRLCEPEQETSRLASCSRISQEDFQPMGVAGNRPNGDSEVSTDRRLFLSTCGQRGSRNRCSSDGLEQIFEGLCIPPSGDDRADSEQDFSVQSKLRIHCSNSVETQGSVVWEDSTLSQRTSFKTTCQRIDSCRPSRLNLLPKNTIWEQDKIRRMEAFWKGRPQLGQLSAGASKVLQSSWATTTQESYGLGYRYYSTFCERNGLDEFKPDPVNLINFLQFEFEYNNRAYRTLNNLRSSVSSTLGPCPVSGKPIGQDMLVCRYMRGVKRLRPPKQALFPNWEISKVLDYLKSLGDSSSLSLTMLLKKTAFLVALVCFKRPSDLCNMQITDGYWYLSASSFACQPLGFSKTEMHNPAEPIYIKPFYEDEVLCPVKSLCTLALKLDKLRPKTEKRFWISAKKPNNGIASQTMAMWLKSVILEAGCLGKARDVRSVGVSTAIQTGFDLDKVLKAGDWQRLSTVRRHYFKPQKLPNICDILSTNN